jgi:Domain of unknown function (DUF4129)
LKDNLTTESRKILRSHGDSFQAICSVSPCVLRDSVVSRYFRRAFFKSMRRLASAFLIVLVTLTGAKAAAAPLQFNQLAASATEDPRVKVREILSRPQFQPKRENPITAFFKEVWNKIAGFFNDIFSALSRLLSKLIGAGGGGNWLAWLIIFAALAGALFGVYRVLKGREPRRKRAKKRLVLGEEVEADATARDLADRAMAAARRGDFRTAMRGLYIALLYDLAERKLIELEDSATNREYLKRVSRFNQLVPAMRYLTDRFDYFWYGMFPSTEADFSSYLTRYKEAAAQVELLGRQAA